MQLTGLTLIKLLFGEIEMMKQQDLVYLLLIQEIIMMNKIGYLNLNLNQFYSSFGLR
ncbi:unnamed protein product [Paramecium sonneborni]|uniref:Uncharacterized protein n=1 Tax=Paramecium sonneborni TaxID=65129 RepID=A0A8S1PS21_9CILI|nr:unnamed protein product [Paramecium sonneborni]